MYVIFLLSCNVCRDCIWFLPFTWLWRSDFSYQRILNMYIVVSVPSVSLRELRFFSSVNVMWCDSFNNKTQTQQQSDPPVTVVAHRRGVAWLIMSEHSSSSLSYINILIKQIPKRKPINNISLPRIIYSRHHHHWHWWSCTIEIQVQKTSSGNVIYLFYINNPNLIFIKNVI